METTSGVAVREDVRKEKSNQNKKVRFFRIYEAHKVRKGLLLLSERDQGLSFEHRLLGTYPHPAISKPGDVLLLLF